MDLRQFKFTGGEEIICEVVQWPDEEVDTMVVRRAMKIVSVEDIEEGLRYYTFKPWMSMNNDPEMLTVVNPYHIISENTPAKAAEDSFYDVVKEMREFGAEEELENSLFTQDSDSSSNVIEFNKKLLH
jgi:hypothetical protein